LPRFGDATLGGAVEGFRLEQARAFVRAIREPGAAEPSFDDGLACQAIVDAVAESAGGARWVPLDTGASAAR
jgi:predicted dehydrogenase